MTTFCNVGTVGCSYAAIDKTTAIDQSNLWLWTRLEVCGNGFQLPIPSHSHKFQSHSITTPAKHLFHSLYFPLQTFTFPPILISILDYLTLTTILNNINGNSYNTILHKSQHCCFTNTNPRHNFRHDSPLCYRNKSTIGLCVKAANKEHKLQRYSMI